MKKAKLMFGPSNLPKVDENDIGIKRRLIMGGRYPGRAFNALNETALLVASLPGDAKNKEIVYFACTEQDINVLKNHPNVVRVGRWFYYNVMGKLIYIKVVTLKQMAFKETKYTRIYKKEIEDYKRFSNLEKKFAERDQITLDWQIVDFSEKKGKKAK